MRLRPLVRMLMATTPSSVLPMLPRPRPRRGATDHRRRRDRFQLRVMSVDLPAALSPTRPRTSPAPSVRSALRSVSTAPNALTMPRISTSGAPTLTRSVDAPTGEPAPRHAEVIADGLAAVAGQQRGCRVARLVGGEEHGDAGDIVTGSHATHRHALAPALVDLGIGVHALGARSPYKPGRDGVGPDAVGRPLEGHESGEHNEPGLHHAVGAGPVVREQAGHGGDVDETARLSRDHVARRGLTEEERALEPDVHRGVPGLLRQRFELAGNDPHRVVDDDVDASSLANGRLDDARDDVALRDVARDRH